MLTKVKCALGFLLACLSVFAVAQTPSGEPQTVTAKAAAAGTRSVVRPEQQSAISAYVRLPLSFEPAHGQRNRDTGFVARGLGYSLSLNRDATVLSLHRPRPAGRRDRREKEAGALAPTTPPIALQLRLLGANVSAQAAPEDLLPGKSNYLIGNDRSQWRTNVANYARVRYRSVYPGIDVVYYGNQRLLEHDFEVSPGADPRKIRLAFDGARRVEIAASGDLVLHVADGELRLHKPLIYQQAPQGKREIAGGFVLSKKQEVSIRVGNYDRTQTLIIDPTLAYSTYLGGTSEDWGGAVATDSAGNAYVVGTTSSTAANGFPIKTQISTTGCAAVTPAGCSGAFDDVFVTKINPSGTGGVAGTALVYSTYLGGNGDDEGYAVSVDSLGNAYVTGFTQSSDFPLSTSPAPYQSTLLSNHGNAFVSKIGSAGNTLLYSTYLGGHARDWGNAITQDAGGNIYVTGRAYSNDFASLTPLSAPPPTIYASRSSGASFSPGAGLISLQVDAIAVDRNTPGTLYAGQAGGGVYKSTDFGATWTATVATPSFTHALILDPATTADSAILYEGSHFNGVRKITGGGTGSTFINSGLTPSTILSLALDPTNNGILYAGTGGSGVWVSQNVGLATPTWGQVTTTGLGDLTVNALAIDPATDIVYAGTNAGVYQLAPGGTSWTTVAGGPTALPVLGLSIDSSSNVYAASFGGGLFKLSAGAWATLNGSGGTALGTLNLRAVAVDPASPSIVYAGGRVGLYRSADGGATWTAINAGLTANSVECIAIDPATTSNLYAGMINLMTFVAKFNSGGTPTMLGYFGGASGSTQAFAIAVDDPTSQNMFIAGDTSSAAMPTPLVGQAFGGNTDGFIAKISTVGTPAVVWDRYLGGTFDEQIFGLARDQSGNLYATGYTTSANFPVTAATAYQRDLNGPANTNADAFLSQIDPSGTSLLYSTYFGGTGWDEGIGVGVVPVASVASVTLTNGGSGYTSAPTVTFSGGGGSGATATATFSAASGQVTGVTVPPGAGGSGYVQPPAVAFSGGGGTNATAQAVLSATSPLVSVAGDSNSNDLPTVNPIQAFLAGGYDTFFTRFDPSQSGAPSLLYSTYLGGTGDEFVYWLALDSLGAPWIVGPIYSTNFPTTANAVQSASSTVASSGDAFVYKLQSTGNASDMSLSMSSGAGTAVAEGTTYSYSIVATDHGPNAAGAPSVVVSGTMPTNLAVNSVIPGQGTCSGLQTFTCSLGTVAFGGAGVTVTVNVTANTLATPPVGPTLTVIARVSTADDDPVPTNNVASLQVTVQRQADLAITNLSGPASVANGTAFNYSVTAANNGLSTATAIIVSYPLPANVTFNAASSSAGCALSTGTVTCPVVNLTPFSSTVIVIKVTPSVVGPLSSTFTVSSSQVVDDGPGGGLGANNSVTSITNVNANIDLVITAPASLTVPVSGSAALALTIHNNSTTDTATFPQFQVNLPAGMSYVSFSSPNSGVSCGVEGTVFCSLPDLAPNTSITATIFATAVLQANYSATSSVSFSGTDTNSANNSASTQVTFTGTLNSSVTTLLTDFETSTLRAYSGFPFPSQVCCAAPALVGASPDNIVIAPNGRLAFVANINGSYISVIDLTIQAEITRIRDVRAWSLALTSDGTKLAVVGQTRDELDIIDVATFAVTRISLDGQVGDAAGVNDIHPFALTVVGWRAYIANQFGPVIVVDFTTLPSPATISTVANTAALNALPVAGHHVAATPDGSTVLVFGVPTAGGNAVVYLITTSTDTATTVSTTFAGARAVAITPTANAATGVLVFLAQGAVINTLDLRTGSETYGQLLPGATVTLPTAITDMALTPDGSTLQVISGPVQGLTGSSRLYTLNANSFLSSPSTALVSTVTIAGAISTRGIAIGYVQNSPLAGAPQVFDVVPAEITNEAAKTVTIFGDNFAPGALVRLGNLDPLSSAFVSRQQINVTVPAAAAVQVANIVVTLPNSAAGPLAANVSGGGPNNGVVLRIGPPPAFAPSHPVAVSSFSTDNLALLFRDSTLIPAAPETYSLAISSDGLFAYTGLWEFTVTNLDNQIRQVTSIYPGSGFGPDGDGIAIAPDPKNSGKKVAYFVSADTVNQVSDTLYIVDVDPASTTTHNTLLRTIQAAPTDFNSALALAVTPDGRFVYSADVNSTNGGTRLVIFDVLNATSTVIPDITTLGADPYQAHMQVTPDGQSLLLTGGASSPSIKVYDIQGTNALAPVLVTTITGSGAPTTNPPLLYWFQVVGTASPRLYAYASDQRYIQIFNFDRTTPNFASLGSYTIPSVPGAFAGSAMAVTPEGTLIYALLENEDAVAVLDAQAIASGLPSGPLSFAGTGNPLITKMRTPVNPSNLAISPRGNASADLFATISTLAPHVTEGGPAIAGVNQPFDVIIGVQNNGPAAATGVTMTLDIPAGIVVNSAVIIEGLASFICSVSTTQVLCPVDNWHVGDFVSVDVNVSATALGSYTFINTVAGNELDPIPASNAASLDVSVPVTADVSVTVSASPNPVAVGQPVTLTATVTNNGPAVATAVSGSLFFAFVSPPVYSASQGTCTTFGTCSLGDLAAGASATITATTTFTAFLANPSSPTVQITGVASTTAADPNAGNNFFTLDLPLTNPATPLQRWLVADRATGRITILDSATNTPIGQTVPAGVNPDAIAISPNRHIAFVANLNATYISVVDLSIQQEIYRIRFGDAGVRNLALTPDGSRVVAILANAPKLLIIDAVTFQLLNFVDLTPQFSDLAPGAPSLIGLAVTGHQAYVAAASSSGIAVVDTNTFAAANVSGVTGTVILFAGNSTMAATPDGLYVVAVRQSPNSLQLISTATNSVVQTVSSTAVLPNTKIAVGARTSAPLGTYGYFGANVINVLDLTPSSPNFGQIVGFTDSLSFAATDLAVSPDGSQLYAITTSSSSLNNAAVVDTGALLSDSASVVFQGRFGGSCISTNNCPATLRAVAAGYVDTLPIAGAPVISGVTPILVFNDTPTTITISGSGFPPDARVRFGKMAGQGGAVASGNELQVTVVSSNELQVTIPAGAPAHARDIIVTNPNVSASLTGQLLSGFLKGGADNGELEIISPIAYQPKFQAVVSDFGAGAIDFLSRSGGNGSQIFVGTDPLGTAFSPDGSQFYAESPSTASVVTGSTQCCQNVQFPQNSQIKLSGQPGQIEGIATAANPDTGKPAVFVSSQVPSTASSPDVQLNVIDADPFSPAVNSILYTIPAHLGSSVVAGGLAVRSDGRYVYQILADGRLVIFDVAARSATIIPAGTLGNLLFNRALVSSDGQTLLLIDIAGNSSVKAFDISANPLSPALLTTINPFVPPGTAGMFFDSLALVGNHLYAYDSVQRIVEAFNFNRANEIATFVNYFVVPGSAPPANGYIAGMAVTPDESLLYASNREDDSVAVIDNAKLLSGVQGDPAMLVTVIGTAQGPSSLSISPKRLDTTVEDVAIAITHSTNPVQLGSNVAFDVTLTNYGPFSGMSSQGSGDSGFLINFDKSLIPVSSTFANSPFVSCTLNATQLLCAFSGNGPDLGPPPQFLSGNMVFQTTTVGNVSVTGYIDGGAYDPDTANNVATDAADVVATDLAVTSMTTSPAGTLAPNTNLTYAITVMNNGPSPSTGFTVTDTLPAGATFLSTPSSIGCTAADTTVTCAGPALGVGQTAIFIIVVTPTAQGTLTNTASVSGNDVDTVPENNFASVQNSVIAADISVTAGSAPISVGGLPAFTATVMNNGPAVATGVVLTDLLDHYGFVSATSTQGSCNFTAPNVTCSIGNLANGASAVVTIVVTAPKQAWAANIFSVFAFQPDPILTNNAFRVGPPLDSFNTPVGSNVAVLATDTADGLIASVTFSNVTRTGSTTMNPLSAAGLPPGFRTGRQPTIFDISSNAEFTGAIALTIHFVPSNFRHPALVRLFHYEAGAWVDRTAGLDAASGAISGRVLSLSPFALLEPLDIIPVANAGADRAVPGVMAAGARVTLDGAASVDADDDALTYRWSGPFPEGGGVVTGVNPSISLPLGVSKVSLVVNDGEADSPAVSVNIAVADFQLSAPSASITLNRGQSTAVTITSTPQYGAFAAPVSLSCAPSAPDVTCSFSTASITPGASGATATLTVTAGSSVARVHRRTMPRQLALWLGTLPLFGIVFVAASRRGKLQMAVLLMLLLLLVAMHVGCGGGGMSQGSSSPTTPGAKTVTVTVTGTSGTLQHTSSVTVTIPR